MQGGMDGRWLTYAELAEIRRVDKPSALKLAVRRGWPRRKNNHGTMQVCVPAEWLTPFGAGMPPDTPDAMPPTVPDQAFEAAIASLTAARDQAEKRVDEARNDAERERTRADQERLRADELRGQLERMGVNLEVARHDAEASQEAAAKLRLADEARKARGRLARLSAAWRGE